MRLIAFLLFFLLLTGCGQKGRLYLPEPPQAEHSPGESEKS